MEGFTIIEIHPCGKKPVMLLRRGDEWCVYRSTPKFTTSEKLARACVQCMLQNNGKAPRCCWFPTEGAQP